MIKNFIKKPAVLAGAFLLFAALFMACPQEADDLSKTALTERITAAEQNRDSVDISILGNGNDVEVGVKWVTLQAKNDYNVAIAAAKKVLYNANATRAEIDQAIAALDTATAVFNPLKKDGLNPNYNVYFLRIAIYNAENLLADTPASVTESGIEYLPEFYWALAADRTAFQAIITRARATAGDLTADQSDIDTIASILSVSTQKFNLNDRKQGIKPDKTALIAAINAAEENYASALESINGTEVVERLQWVTAQDKFTYSTAIAAAKLVRDAAANNTTVVQSVVDGAISTLATATGVYNTAKKAGSLDPATLPVPVLQSATITAASKLALQLTFDEAITLTNWQGFSFSGSVSTNGITNFTLDPTGKILTLTLNYKPSFDEVGNVHVLYNGAGTVSHKYNTDRKVASFDRVITITGFTAAADARPTLTNNYIDGQMEWYWRENKGPSTVLSGAQAGVAINSSTTGGNGTPVLRRAPQAKWQYARRIFLDFSANVWMDNQYYHAFTVKVNGLVVPGVRISRFMQQGYLTSTGHNSANPLRVAGPGLVLFLTQTLSESEANTLTVSYDGSKGNLQDGNGNKAASFTDVPVTVSNYPSGTPALLPVPDILDVVLTNEKTAYNAAIDHTTVTNFTPQFLTSTGSKNSIFVRMTSAEVENVNCLLQYMRFKWDSPGGDTYFAFPYGTNLNIVNALNGSFSIESAFCSGSTDGTAMGNSSVRLKKSGDNYLFVIKLDGEDRVLSTEFGVGNENDPGYKRPRSTWWGSDVVGVWDKSTKTMSIYVDGTLENSQVISTAGNFTQPTNPGQWISINGQANDSAAGITNPNGGGEVNIGRIWGKALSATEILELFHDTEVGELWSF